MDSSNQKTTFINVCKQCLDIFRDREGLTGGKALKNLSYFLTLKLLEKQFDGNIDIEKFDYHFDETITNLEDFKKCLFRNVRFSNLSSVEEDDITTVMTDIWDNILSQHPVTKNIFVSGKFFDAEYQSTYKCIVDKFNTLDFVEDFDFDILGGAYEEVIKHIMVGKTLGQYFTQSIVKNLMVKLIKPKVFADGTIETCVDPTMGTAGFLTTYLKYIKKRAIKDNVELDWDFIKTKGVYGKEIETDTFQLAISNMLISTGHMFEHLEKGDSIRDPIVQKFDNILANPPFGIKGLNYDDFHYSIKNEYVPIKSSNAVCLFLQAIIYMLKIGGKCAVVFPDGQELHSKTNKVFTCVRQYLLKTCNLKEIVYLPSSSFTNTSIKTCVLYFVKKEEGSDVLSVKTKTLPTTQKETSRIYSFTDKQHNTDVVRFYDYNEEKEKTLLVEVPIENIIEKQYSLNKSDYIERVVELRNDKVEMKTLEEICEFLPKSKRLASFGNTIGKYNFYTSSSNLIKFCDECDYNDECLIIGTGGNANIKYSKQFSCSADNIIMKRNGNNETKYIYYYLLFNIEKLDEGFVGVGLKHISKAFIAKIDIPLPSIEVQQEIVKYLDFIYEKSIKTSIDKIEELKQMNEYCLSNQAKYGDNEVKTLGEICNFDIGGTPSRNNEDYYNNGTNLWCSVKELNGSKIYDTKEKITDDGVKNSSVKLFKKGTILFSFKLSIGKTAIVGKELYTNEAIAGINTNDDSINQIYLYYYLTINDFSYMASGVMGVGSLNKKTLSKIQISIPSLEHQEQIIKYCEYNDNLIEQLENEIENNKEQAKLFINNIVKA